MAKDLLDDYNQISNVPKSGNVSGDQRTARAIEKAREKEIDSNNPLESLKKRYGFQDVKEINPESE